MSLFREIIRTCRERTIEAGVERGMRAVYVRRVKRHNPFVTMVAGQRVVLNHRNSDADAFGAWQCFYREQYRLPPPLFEAPHHAKALSAYYDTLVASGRIPLIIDAGAHIGAGSLWFAAQYPRARIVAVEPADDNLAILRQNAAGDRITVVAGAIGRADGHADLADVGQSSMGYRVGGQGPSRRVEMFSLPTLLSRHAEGTEPFILKLDIEGSERELFGGGNDAAAERFPLIILEEHDFLMPGSATAAGFFRFHADRRRDFVFANENIFSFDMRQLQNDA